MRNFFKKIFRNPSTVSLAAVPTEFSGYARTAIQLIAGSNGQLEDEGLRELLIEKGIPEIEATELLLFLPTVFCRHMLPQVAWPDFYINYISEKEQHQIKYSQNLRYVAMQQAMNSYIAGDFTQADFLKVAGRSASFKVINSLLADNPNFKPEDVELTPEYVVR